MQDIMTILQKELWQLQFSVKKIIILISFILLPIACVLYNVFITDARALLPVNYLTIYGILIVAIGISSDIVFNSILDEKKTKTLESLLSTNISKFAIIIGKAIPGVVISSITSTIALLILKISSLTVLKQYNVSIDLSFDLFFLLIAASYISSCVTLLVTIIVNDEKIIPTITTIPLILIIFLISKFGLLSNISLIHIIIVLAICVIVTWISKIAINKINLIEKI